MNLRLEDIRYEREVAQAINQSGNVYKTLSVENYLDPIGIYGNYNRETNLSSPLEIFTPSSTFHFTIVEKMVKTESKKYARANIPITELAKISRRTQIATEKIVEAEMTPAKPQETPEDIAYTTHIRVGSFKGFSPAQILLQDPKQRDSLEETMLWLEKKTNFSGNAMQAAAIREALTLFDTGKLAQKDNISAKVISIHDADYRPLRSTKRKDGKMMMYTIHIKCYPGDSMPYEVIIKNVWAEFNEMQMVAGTAGEQVKVSMRLTESDWDNMVEGMLRTKRIYENVYGAYELENSLKSQEKKYKMEFPEGNKYRSGVSFS